MLRPLRNVVFRTDARPEIGYGHFFRCLALANQFAARGTHCILASSVPSYMQDAVTNFHVIDDLSGGMRDWDNQSFLSIVAQSDLLITDLYEIDAAWQRHSTIPVLAIADPPVRDQHCDLLLLPTSFQHPSSPNVLTAPSHALIRSEIHDRRTGPKTGSRLLVNCGGGRDSGLTLRILEALVSDAELRDISGTVVLGDISDADTASIEACVSSLQNMSIEQAVKDMAVMIADHDWAIGTPGGSALERACLGLAQILIPIADNQEALGDALHSSGATATLAPGSGSTAIAEIAHQVYSNAAMRHEMASLGFELIDGRGAERVVGVVEKEIHASDS